MVRLLYNLLPISMNIIFIIYNYHIELYCYIFFRSLESQLFNKANELQEDISLKRFDQRIAQIHLAAVKAQVSVVMLKSKHEF